MIKSNKTIVVFLLFLLFQSLFAQKAELDNLINLVSSKDNFKGSPAQLSGASFAPNNRNVISFNRQVGDYRQLWLYNAKNKKLTQITTIESQLNEDDILDLDSRETTYYESELSWSPVNIRGKQWFVFVSAGKYANWDLYLGELGSSQFIRLTSDKSIDSQPVWSPDGNRIAFTSSRSGNGDIYIIDNVKNLVQFYNTKRYNKSVENKLIFDISDELEKEIFSGSNGKERRLIQITDNKYPEIDPCFSPDGKYVAIAAEDYDDKVLNYGISIIKLDGYSSPKRFTTSTKTESKPVWSPDGRFIVYYSSGNIKDDTRSIIASDFTEFGEYAKRIRVVAKNILSSGYKPPELTFMPNNGVAVVYHTNNNKENYSVWVAPIRNFNNKKLLYSQRSYIDNASCVDNSILVTRQVGDNFLISYSFSNNLQKYKKRNRYWTGEISKSKTLYYYIGGGAIGAGGILAWILSGGEVEKPKSITLGTPNPPIKH